VATVTRTLELPYPQEEVFDFIADLRNELAWHPDVESVELEEGGAVGVGASFTATYRRIGKVFVRIAEYQRPWHVRFEATGRITATYDHRLSAHDGGTVLETTAATPLRGLAWLLYPLTRGRVERQFTERGELIRKGLDARRDSGART
jgi:hypothetical protein